MPLCIKDRPFLEPNASMQESKWDTIIVGAGSAGCALAARLSADPNRRVLLLEAGPTDRELRLRVPAGGIVGHPRFDWCFSTEPEPHLNNRRIRWPRGKVLGGSSAINGLLAVRGQPEDYDGWRESGCIGWAWSDVLPYFIRLENYERGASDLHGTSGPLPLSLARRRSFICDVYRDAALEVGIPSIEDFNGPTQAGFGYHHVNVSRGLIPTRVSAATAYLDKARSRRNLCIVTGALVQRIEVEAHRATGVLYVIGDVRHRATAARQIILAAGAIGSPHLLQLSGIGDGCLLRTCGIPVVHDVPAVGRNLQDHLQTSSIYRLNIPTFTDWVRAAYSKIAAAFEGLIMRNGPYYGVSQFGFFACVDGGIRPDVQFHVHSGFGSFMQSHAFSELSVSAWQLRPQSRGTIQLTSPDPRIAPAICANYLSADVDRRLVVAGLRFSRQLARTAALSPYIAGEQHPGPDAQSDEELLGYARQNGHTTFHPVGTCRMGSDAQSVVDPGLRVRGIQRLYVADASIMPTLISGNTHVPTVMIGEKASDMIVEDEQQVESLVVQAFRPALQQT
jgi:choline dehydrogenase-like flavoprotein